MSTHVLPRIGTVRQDPHFKAANHRRRIIQRELLTEYAHLMAPGGWLYTITDVPDLGAWMVRGQRGCDGVVACRRGARVRAGVLAGAGVCVGVCVGVGVGACVWVCVGVCGCVWVCVCVWVGGWGTAQSGCCLWHRAGTAVCAAGCGVVIVCCVHVRRWCVRVSGRSVVCCRHVTRHARRLLWAQDDSFHPRPTPCG
jgi:hypothetical protein